MSPNTKREHLTLQSLTQLFSGNRSPQGDRAHASSLAIGVKPLARCGSLRAAEEGPNTEEPRDPDLAVQSSLRAAAGVAPKLVGVKAETDLGVKVETSSAPALGTAAAEEQALAAALSVKKRRLAAKSPAAKTVAAPKAKVKATPAAEAYS